MSRTQYHERVVADQLGREVDLICDSCGARVYRGQPSSETYREQGCDHMYREPNDPRVAEFLEPEPALLGEIVEDIVSREGTYYSYRLGKTEVLYVFKTVGAGWAYTRMVGSFTKVAGFATKNEALEAGLAYLSRLSKYAVAATTALVMLATQD